MHAAKVQRLRDELQAKGAPLEWASNRALRLAWRWGWRVPPPLYWGHFGLLVASSVGVSLLYPVLAALYVRIGLPVSWELYLGMLAAGQFVGLICAQIIGAERRRLGVPRRWRDV